MLHHLDNATAPGGDGDSSSPAAAVEHLSLLLLAAVLEVDKEDAAVAKRVEKRLAKDSGISNSTGAASAAGHTSPGRRSHASALAFEYRAKALAKDAAAAVPEDGRTVGGRLSEAMEALCNAGQQASGGGSGGGGGLMMEQPQQEGGGDGSDDAGAHLGGARREAWKALVVRFCRAYLGRAVQIAETGSSNGGGGGGSSGPSDPTTSRWREVLAACDAVERAVGGSGWDEGWAASVTLLASAYAHPDRPESGRQGGDGDKEAALELLRTAEGGAEDGASPWLRAEACLHLAGLALRAGDVAKADALLKAASAAAAATRAQLRVPGSPKDGGASTAGVDVSWAGALSGPGSDWRELSLRCLVDERLAGGSAGGPGDATAAAALGLGRVEAAIGAFDESFRLRGAPADGGAYADVLGSLGLASASLLLKLGRVEEARSAVETASTGVSEAGGAAATGGHQCLHHRALCVASEIDLAEGDTKRAKEKLREVLTADPSSADALSRLGWLLLGFLGGGSAAGAGAGGRRCRREDVDAAKPLLERAAAEEPECSSHAFRLARCGVM